MSRPKIFTSDFWTVRLDNLVENFPRMIRTGAQFVIGAIGQDRIGQLSLFDLDAVTLAGSFLGGCVVWLVTTLAAPPKD